MKKYKLTLFNKSKEEIDSTTLYFDSSLARKEILKKVRTYLYRIGYCGYPFNLKKI